MIFGTKTNLEHSIVWFLDGTFKVSPNLFSQLFTIIGIERRCGRQPVEYDVDVPVHLTFSLLSSKDQVF